MNQLLDHLLGIKPSQWAAGGTRRLEWLEMPKHHRLFLLLLAVLLATYGLLWPYPQERRNLGLPLRIMFATLRMVALLGVVVMLLEPVVVFEKSEFVPSTILVLRDQSESMDLRDAFASQAYADRLAQSLALPGGA